MAMHAVITFLEDSESLKGVDPDFRKLVEIFHRIPFCASFGVSCAGHFHETDENARHHPNCFTPSPWGHLNAIVLPTVEHIQELLKTMEQFIGSQDDATFKTIQHPFGPPKDSKLEVWEIRIGDNGCLGECKEEVLFGGSFPKADNPQLYQNSKSRSEEIKLFWEILATKLLEFCQENGFGGFDLDKRVDEILGAWDEVIESTGQA